MRSYHALVLPLSFTCSVLIAATAWADSSVEGSLHLGHGEWTAVDVIGFHDGNEIAVVFSDRVFDRARMEADGRIDVFDIMQHDGNTMTLNVTDDGPAMCLHIQARDEDTLTSGSTCQSSFQPAIQLDVHSADRVSGSMDWEGDDDQYVRLRFEVAIASEEDLRADAEPLPADGGEPGKAVLAHFAALEAGDYEGLKAISHPEAQAMMEASEEDGDHMELFEFLREMSPRNLVVTGGSAFGDNAEVSFEAVDDDRPVRGTANVVQHEGRWYFQGTTIHD